MKPVEHDRLVQETLDLFDLLEIVVLKPVVVNEVTEDPLLIFSHLDIVIILLQSIEQHERIPSEVVGKEEIVGLLQEGHIRALDEVVEESLRFLSR